MQIILNGEHYPQINEDNAIDYLGMIPFWVNEFEQVFDADTVDDIGDLQSFLEDKYGFGKLIEMEGSTVGQDGEWVSSHDDDPDIYPYAMYPTDFGFMYQYPYGVVAIPTGEPDNWFITRMD
jgi:hypothetical protein